uniref:Uncharacterized protein n=1 Tax=Meloidogyne incognita TaxID=6306 RepID=A0A914NKD5_MELIC
MYKAGMCASAAADEINYEFDLSVIAEKMAERYVKEHCPKGHIEYKETKVAKKPMVFNIILINFSTKLLWLMNTLNYEYIDKQDEGARD